MEQVVRSVCSFVFMAEWLRCLLFISAAAVCLSTYWIAHLVRTFKIIRTRAHTRKHKRSEHSPGLLLSMSAAACRWRCRLATSVIQSVRRMFDRQRGAWAEEPRDDDVCVCVQRKRGRERMKHKGKMWVCPRISVGDDELWDKGLFYSTCGLSPALGTVCLQHWIICEWHVSFIYVFYSSRCTICILIPSSDASYNW